jgi:hypothetical protein
MIFEYMYEVTDPAVAEAMKGKMKTKYLIGGIMLRIDFMINREAELEVNNTEILYVVDTESDVPIMLHKEDKCIAGDFINYDSVDARCYEEADTMRKDMEEYYND